MHQVSSIGGGSYCLLNVIKAIDKQFWKPVVALKSHGTLEDEIKKIGVEVVIFPQMAEIPYNQPLGWQELRKYHYVKRSEKYFEDLLRKKQIDVLYLNNMMISPYLRPAKRVGCKTILHVREHWPLNEHIKQLEWIRKIVYNNCDKLIAINHYSASIFPKIKSTIVYDWIDMGSRYREMPLNEIFEEDVSEKKVLLFTGGFLRIKGAKDVINTFKNRVKGDEYRLLIVGVNTLKTPIGFKHSIKSFLSRFGYPYYEQEMLKIVKEDSRIRCIPGVYELTHLIEQSYCFISYFSIPHANLALAENIVLGNPCIVADNEEAREYSYYGTYALLVKPNAPEEFARQLNLFLLENDKWREAAKSGAEKISQLFSKENNVKILNEAIRDL